MLDQSVSSTDRVFGPKQNVLLFNDGQSDTQDIKDPTLEVIIDLNDQENAQHLTPDKAGISFFS